MIDLLGLGFAIGFGFALLSFIASELFGKKNVVSIRISTLTIGFLVIIFYVVPVKITPVLKLTGLLFLTALILNSIIGSMQLIISKFLDKEIGQKRKLHISSALFLIAAISSVILNLLAPAALTQSIEYVLSKLIFIGLGILIALILLWKPSKK